MVSCLDGTCPVQSRIWNAHALLTPLTCLAVLFPVGSTPGDANRELEDVGSTCRRFTLAQLGSARECPD